jgi:hypothetical protein
MLGNSQLNYATQLVRALHQNCRCNVPNRLVYFTFTTYRNLLFTTEKGNHPVFIGPGILHKQKLKTSYQTLPQLMTKYYEGTNGVLVFGTDGEENLADAFSQVCPNAKHLCKSPKLALNRL